MQIEIPHELKKLCKLLHNNLFLVGGFVRNSLMGLPTDDIDICSDATLDELQSLLAGSEFDVKAKSKTLGTAIITTKDNTYEYSVFRREVYDQDGSHSPSSVEFIKDIKEDAKRRDFTINAIYYDIYRDELIDFYRGIEDIDKRLLRTVETPEFVLSTDGVRILRLFRFQSELGFNIEKHTLECAIKYSSNVKSLSGERVVYEMERILHSSQRYPGYSRKNAFMRSFKLFNKFSLWQNFGIDVSKIRLKMVKRAGHKTQGFLVDLVDTVNPISVAYYLQHFLTDIGLNKKIMANLINILSGYYDALNGLDNKNYFFKYFDNYPTIDKLLSVKSKFLAAKYGFFYRYILSHKVVIQVRDLKINGDDIKEAAPNIDPKRYKAILSSLLSDVFDGKVQNNKEELLKALENKLKYL